ncbi:hypothetical protein V6O07_04650, partial [Arthrospira platensis SPKY2]
MPVYLNIPIEKISNKLNLDLDTTTEYLNTLNIQGIILNYKQICIDGSFPLKIGLQGSITHTKPVYINQIDLTVDFNLLMKAHTYKQIFIRNDLDLSIQLCLTGSIEVEDYRKKDINPLTDILYPNLEMKLKELLDIPKDYITYDLRILIENHNNLLPEIGEIIHFSCNTLTNFREQDKVRIEVTDSKILHESRSSYERRKVWLSAIVYFEDIPTLWLLNEYWDRVVDHPLRFVLNLPSFSRMITFLRSLIQLDENEKDIINILRTDPMQSYAKTTSYPVGNLKIFNNPMKEEDVQCLFEIVTKFITLHKEYYP